jgi:hypothetical protein
MDMGHSRQKITSVLIQLNRFLYTKTGIHGSALAVKCYIKGLFGFQSVGYQQISGLKFINENMK